METNNVIDAANKTFIAMKNPYGSVERVFPRALEKFRAGGSPLYLGIKNTNKIPRSFIERLEKTGNYVLHTIDVASMGGRAVDVKIVNPLSGRPMSGSSSGTAVNVLLGINDVGIGTDGGGSVLAPALALNLFGFISPLIEGSYLQQFSSTSTDGISFSASIGFISREWEELERVVGSVLDLPSEVTEARVASVDPNLDIWGPREPLIAYLRKELFLHDVLVSEEGPVDFNGFGDTVLGHLGDATGELQRASGKGLMRVVNMAGATAVVVPKQDFARGTLLVCESTLPKIKMMLVYAQQLALPQDALVKRYFQDIATYFGDEF